jgi:hypothetical protein
VPVDDRDRPSTGEAQGAAVYGQPIG